MNKLIDFITKTNDITGVSFASIRNYTNSSKETANVVINLGATLESAKAKDLKTMQNTTAKKLYFTLSNKDSMSYNVFETAFNELYNSFVPTDGKNIDGTTKERSNRSYAQTDAYTIVNNSVKVHNEFNRLYIYGLQVSKEVLIAGEYKTVNKQAKTVCKDAIKKALQFKSEKFRMYIVEGIDVLNLSKTSFNGSELSINL